MNDYREHIIVFAIVGTVTALCLLAAVFQHVGCGS